jgi:hypothetical protein
MAGQFEEFAAGRPHRVQHLSGEKMNARRKRLSRRGFEEISEAELRDIIKKEANMLGLRPREAVRRAKRGTLPRNKLGDDLSLLVQLLPA